LVATSGVGMLEINWAGRVEEPGAQTPRIGEG